MRLASIVSMLLVLSACSETVAPLVPTTLSISPVGEVTLILPETQLYTAVVHDQDGGVVNIGVTWTVAPANVASVSLDGLVTALEPGTAVITAAVGSARAVVALTVVAPFEVVIDNVVSEYGFNVETARFECRYTLTAQALGGLPGTQAQWLASEWTFRFLDATSSTYALSALDMVDYWGSSVIGTGVVQEARRIAWSDSEFDLVYTLRYSVGLELRSNSVFVDCNG